MSLLVIPIMFFATLIQAMTGFGGGLISMPFLIAILGLSTAAPAFSLATLLSGIIMVFRYRQALSWSEIWRVSLMSVLTIPIGVWGAKQIPQHTVLLLLGLMIVAYALYSLIGWRVPKLSSNWGFSFGAVAGLLQGAYNTGGPPLVMYGTSQAWQPEKFKGNVQFLLFINGLVTTISHFLAGNLTLSVWENTALMIPAMLAGLFLGVSMDKYIKPEVFRRLVLGLLLIIGLKMLFG